MVQLPEMPDRIARLPRDHRGYPVPWFVAWEDGKPVFPAADRQKLRAAIRERRCWVCGDLLARNVAFVIGPMCSINRVSAEPPCHLECATFSARACPFLTKPKMKRMTDEEALVSSAPGVALARNPGVACVWSTRTFTIEAVNNGVLFRIGEPHAVAWFAEGRTATREEVTESIRTGLPALEEMARAQSEAAVCALREMHNVATKYLPALIA